MRVFVILLIALAGACDKDAKTTAFGKDDAGGRHLYCLAPVVDNIPCQKTEELCWKLFRNIGVAGNKEENCAPRNDVWCYASVEIKGGVYMCTSAREDCEKMGGPCASSENWRSVKVCEDLEVMQRRGVQRVFCSDKLEEPIANGWTYLTTKYETEFANMEKAADKVCACTTHTCVDSAVQAMSAVVPREMQDILMKKYKGRTEKAMVRLLDCAKNNGLE